MTLRPGCKTVNNAGPVRRVNEKSPARERVPGFLSESLLSVSLEVTEQPQDFEVQHDTRHGEAQCDAPSRLLRCASANHLVGGVEVDQKAESRESDTEE